MSLRIPPTVPADVADVLRSLAQQVDTLTGRQNIDLSKRRIINAGKAVQPFDYVTKDDLDVALDGLSIGTAVPSTKVATTITFGTHAQRTALAPAAVKTTFFFESDREALYAVQLLPAPAQWALMSAAMTGSIAGRPGDLGVSEEGFVFYAQDQGVVYYWSGAVWHYECGHLTDTFANRPAAGGSNISGGIRFSASDRGYQTWVYDLPNVRWQFVGGGFPMDVTLSTKPSLGSQDAGFRIWADDYDRIYLWNGSAWQDEPGRSDVRGSIQWFSSVTYPTTGWALCDGSTVTMSTSSGGTTSYTTPNLTGSNRFLRAVSGTSGGTGGSATTHTHSVDPPSQNFTSATESGDQFVKAGTPSDLLSPNASHNHVVTVDISAFSSAGPSGTGGDDALPPYLNARPYVRL